ncbi:MAG TPA: Gfo/Idh/MocA family oxidoreductase [Bryobacteraceae bacterium]|nr:Gfo/Idh/MocA family oxidoreductase [Bryobacteraceae bacterium]
MKPGVLVVGGGMITHDQILPSLLHLQTLGVISQVSVVASRSTTIQKLREAFPQEDFEAHPESGSDPQPALYKGLIAKMSAGNIVIIALPDQLHYEAVMAAIEHGQHVLCVKPLVLTVRESIAIEEAARKKNLVVGIEYHKRFDDRSLMARKRYRAGMFGDFKLGTASLMEKWYYRNSNFQNWMTTENSDAFTYIGCHYIDLVHFITGLLPVSVSVYGVKDKFPNGAEGYLWTDARVIWNNGACLNVQNTLSYPEDGPGSNMQHLSMYCSDGEKGAMIRHSDQYRGIEYSYVRKPEAPGATMYHEPSADYFQMIDLAQDRLTPVGYGYRSIDFIVRQCIACEQSQDKQAFLRRLDEDGIVATPRNSRFNEQVVEAGRESILNGGREVKISS